MQIQTRTDNHIEGHEKLANYVQTTVAESMTRFDEWITRIEVHLSDEHGNKPGPDDKRCVMEARLKGHEPVAVTHHAPSVNQAIDGAIDKLSRLLDNTRGRLQSAR